MLFTGDLDNNTVFVRILLLAEQKMSLIVLIDSRKQILYLVFEIINFWGELDYRVSGKLISRPSVKPGPNHKSCFTPCAALFVAETSGHCGPLALLAMSPAKQTFLQDVTRPPVWPRVPVLCDRGRLALHEAQRLQALRRRLMTHSTETTTSLSTLAGEPSEGDSLCRTATK